MFQGSKTVVKNDKYSWDCIRKEAELEVTRMYSFANPVHQMDRLER